MASFVRPPSTRQTRRVAGRFRARVALGVVALFVGCNVYDDALLGSAVGQGGSASGATGGSAPGAGRGGSSGGSAGSTAAAGGNAGAGGATGGSSGATAGGGGAGATGGSAATGGMEGGADGDGGEDPGVGGSAGAGGSSGVGGSAGNGGTAGTAVAGAGGAGAGGTAGTGGAGAGGAGGAGAGSGGAGAGGAGIAGMGGMPETCTGCARLSVPLAAADNKAHFTLLLPDATDLSAATITFRVAKLAGTGGTLRGYIQEGSPDYLLQDGAVTPLSSIGATMQNIAWSIAGAGTAANKAAIRRIGIEINGAGGSSFTNPTVIYVDSIVVTGATLNPSSYTFDTSGTVHTTPTGQGPTGLIYLNNFSGDTNVTGCAISWLGP